MLPRGTCMSRCLSKASFFLEISPRASGSHAGRFADVSLHSNFLQQGEDRVLTNFIWVSLTF